jgi:hypothetical protein
VGANQNEWGIGDRANGKARPSVYGAKVNTQLADNEVAEGQRLLDETYNPMFDKVQAGMDQLLNKPLFDETLLHQARSNIAQTIKGAEDDRLRRASAALGLRGLNPSSPAGAAIAARTALEADTNLANSLRDFAMQTNMAEQNSQMAELGLASNLVTTRMAATSALRGGNLDRLLSVSSDLDALLEGLRQQREAQALANAQARDAGGNQWAGLAGTVIGGAAGAFFGPAGMMMGSQLGGAIGGVAGGGSPVPNMSGMGSLFGQGGYSDPWSWNRSAPTAAPTTASGSFNPTMSQFFGGA